MSCEICHMGRDAFMSCAYMHSCVCTCMERVMCVYMYGAPVAFCSLHVSDASDVTHCIWDMTYGT